jgi:hypothetical protein
MLCIGRGFGLLKSPWGKVFLPAALFWVVCLRRWAFLVFLAVCWSSCFVLFAFGVGVSLLLSFACGAFWGCLPMALASPCFHVGLFALPLCGAALTFFAAAKKVSKESGSHRQLLGVPHPRIFEVVRARSDPPHTPRSWQSSHSSRSALRASPDGATKGLRATRVATRSFRSLPSGHLRLISLLSGRFAVRSFGAGCLRSGCLWSGAFAV